MNWFPTSSTRACGSEFVLKPIKFVVESKLSFVGFLVGLSSFPPCAREGFEEVKRRSWRESSSQGWFDQAAWRQRGCDVQTCAVGKGPEPRQSICQMITRSHLQSVLEGDQGPEPTLPVIQALSPGLHSIFFTSHRMRNSCCSTVAQQWHPGAISFAVEISLLICKSICTSAKNPLKALGKIPINVNNFWSICFPPWFLAVSKRRALVLHYLCCYLFGWVI